MGHPACLPLFKPACDKGVAMRLVFTLLAVLGVVTLGIEVITSTGFYTALENLGGQDHAH